MANIMQRLSSRQRAIKLHETILQLLSTGKHISLILEKFNTKDLRRLCSLHLIMVPYNPKRWEMEFRLLDHYSNPQFHRTYSI